jgi:flagellar hook-length control protein FliK
VTATDAFSLQADLRPQPLSQRASSASARDMEAGEKSFADVLDETPADRQRLAPKRPELQLESRGPAASPDPTSPVAPADPLPSLSSASGLVSLQAAAGLQRSTSGPDALLAGQGGEDAIDPLKGPGSVATAGPALLATPSHPAEMMAASSVSDLSPGIQATTQLVPPITDKGAILPATLGMKAPAEQGEADAIDPLKGPGSVPAAGPALLATSSHPAEMMAGPGPLEDHALAAALPADTMAVTSLTDLSPGIQATTQLIPPVTDKGAIPSATAGMKAPAEMMAGPGPLEDHALAAALPADTMAVTSVTDLSPGIQAEQNKAGQGGQGPHLQTPPLSNNRIAGSGNRSNTPLSTNTEVSGPSPGAQTPAEQQQEAATHLILPVTDKGAIAPAAFGMEDATPTAGQQADMAAAPMAEIAAMTSALTSGAKAPDAAASPDLPLVEAENAASINAADLPPSAGRNDPAEMSRGRASPAADTRTGASDASTSITPSKPAEAGSGASGHAPVAPGSTSQAGARLAQGISAATDPGAPAGAMAPATHASFEGARAASTGTPANAVPAPTVQVYTRMIERFDGRAQRYEIRLAPEELGRVDVRIEIGADKKVHATLAAHDSFALSDLMRGQRALESALRQAGVDVADGGIRFELSSDNGRNQSNGAPDGEARGRQGGPHDVWRGFSPVRMAADADVAAAVRPWRSSRLDVVA